MQSLGSVRSRDGTTVGYRQFGQGRALILLHGGMMASQNFVRLAVTLSDAFSVFVPDRRGRGMSGPYGDHYTLASDCEDVRALIDHTGASNVFGLSSGAIIALRSALEIPAIRKVAAYEPPVAVEGFHPAHWAERFDREVQRGDLVGALITVLKGTGDSRLLRLVPHALLAPVMKLGVRFNAKQNKPGDVSIADLIPTMHYDAQIVTEASAALEELRAMHSDVLLIGGSKSAAFLRRGLEVLAKLLPRAARLELRGLGHTAADNEGKPERVAEALRSFFEN
jgi:pimeloyl-ACP methyl ester carboxylesterase